jgi:hypothetical protein
MTSLLKSILGTSPTSPRGITKTPSFDDLSLGASSDAQEYVQERAEGRASTERRSMDSQPSLGGAGSPRTNVASPRTNVWQDVFNPGKNFSNKMADRSYYDNVDDKKVAPSTWEYILHAENLKRLSFAGLDKDGDGFIDAKELRTALGPQANVQHLIEQADRNGDGKIDFYEFQELLRKT